MDYKTGLSLKKLVRFHMHYIHSKLGPLFHRRPQYVMRNFILWLWKNLSFGLYFCS